MWVIKLMNDSACTHPTLLYSICLFHMIVDAAYLWKVKIDAFVIFVTYLIQNMSVVQHFSRACYAPWVAIPEFYPAVWSRECVRSESDYCLQQERAPSIIDRNSNFAIEVSVTKVGLYPPIMVSARVYRGLRSSSGAHYVLILIWSILGSQNSEFHNLHIYIENLHL